MKTDKRTDELTFEWTNGHIYTVPLWLLSKDPEIGPKENGQIDDKTFDDQIMIPFSYRFFSTFFCKLFSSSGPTSHL